MALVANADTIQFIFYSYYEFPEGCKISKLFLNKMCIFYFANMLLHILSRSKTVWK